MDVTEALQIVDQATAAVVANRTDHQRIAEAISVIRAALTEPVTTTHENTGTP